jgi:hypothetical protein
MEDMRMRTKFQSDNLKGRDHHGDSGVNIKVDLKEMHCDCVLWYLFGSE